MWHVANPKVLNTSRDFSSTYKVNIPYLILEQEKRWQVNSDRTKQAGWPDCGVCLRVSHPQDTDTAAGASRRPSHEGKTWHRRPRSQTVIQSHMEFDIRGLQNGT